MRRNAFLGISRPEAVIMSILWKKLRVSVFRCALAARGPYNARSGRGLV